jgi:putative ATP-binding cassette transporter
MKFLDTFFASERYEGIRKYLNMLDFSEVPKKNLIIYIAISGIINTLLLSVLSSAANQDNVEGVDYLKLALFSASLLVFYITKTYSLKSSVKAVENAIYETRNRILSKIEKSELAVLERIGKDEIYTRFSNDTADISFSASILVNTCQSIVMLVFTLIYILILSKAAFFFTIIIVSLTLFVFFRKQRGQMALLHEAHSNEISLFGYLDHVLSGFKELKMNQEKRKGIFKEMDHVLTDSKTLKTRFGHAFSKNLIINEISLFILLGFIVFIMPDYFSLGEGILPRITTAILFMIVPITTVVGSLDPIAKGLMAVDRIEKLEMKLNSDEDDYSDDVDQLNDEPFERIELQDVVYDYVDLEQNKTFTLGPINLSINRGEHICIMGGNGSGKSTLFKLIATLYTPSSGVMEYNGKTVDTSNRKLIRSKTGVIFTDFHLFPKVYGIDPSSRNKMEDLISLMGLKEKVSFSKDDSFSDMKLSTGQRKRLALITLMVGDKEIFLLDEITADQDPGFRKFFYEEILKKWKEEGKTILIISHDDRYLQHFDRVYHMEYGKFI